MSLLDIFKSSTPKTQYEIVDVDDLTPEARLSIDRALFMAILSSGSRYLCQAGKVVGAWSTKADLPLGPQWVPHNYNGGVAWTRTAQ